MSNQNPDTSESKKPKPGKTPILSRDKITEAAYLLAKKDPINALSMRKIATKLNVTPMAIYKYFKDKNELTTAVIDTHLQNSQLVPDDIPIEQWQQWTTTSFLRMWDAYNEAPGMLEYISQATTFGPAVLHWQNEVLKVLITAGLSPKQALTGHAAMAELATGSAILVPVRKQGLQNLFPTIWEALQKGNTPNLDNVDSHSLIEYPWAVMCAQAMMDDIQDTRNAFLNELELILNSLAAQIEANKKNS